MDVRHVWSRTQVGESALVGSFFVGKGHKVGWIAGGVVALMAVFGGTETAAAQHKPKQRAPRRETNASRQARIARTVQDTYSHRWEIAGGGGYVRWRSGDATKKNNEVSWDVAANYYLNPKLAIVGDAQGSFGYAHQQLPLQFAQIARPEINEYFFTGGVNYRFYAKERVALSVQGTAGVSQGVFSKGAKALTGPEIGLWNDGYVPAGKISFNVDYNVYPNLALRFSPTYIVTDFQYAPQATVLANAGTSTPTSYSSEIQNTLGFNIGVIYRFGRQK